MLFKTLAGTIFWIITWIGVIFVIREVKTYKIIAHHQKYSLDALVSDDTLRIAQETAQALNTKPPNLYYTHRTSFASLIISLLPGKQPNILYGSDVAAFNEICQRGILAHELAHHKRRFRARNLIKVFTLRNFHSTEEEKAVDALAAQHVGAHCIIAALEATKDVLKLWDISDPALFTELDERIASLTGTVNAPAMPRMEKQ